MEINKKLIFKEYWENKLTRGIDTCNLQVESLSYFLNDIGYNMGIDIKTGILHIVLENRSKGNPKYMSIETAVVLYNGSSIKTNGTTYEYKCFTFSKNILYGAWKNKIVERVYLQRKGTELHTQYNWVKFNYPYTIPEDLGGSK